MVSYGMLKALFNTDLPVWCAGVAAPPSVAGLTFVSWQEPIGCGGVAVFPYDVIVVDEDGAVVVPSALLADVVKEAVEQEKLEAWILGRFGPGPASRVYIPRTRKTKLGTRLFAAAKQKSGMKRERLSVGGVEGLATEAALMQGGRMSQAGYAASNVPSIKAGDALYSKIAWRIMPIVLLSYIIAYLDRVNVGFAKLQMMGDLKFSDGVYGFGAGIFFLGYFFFEIPSNLILHRVGARVWICRVLVTWGIISGCTAFVRTPWEFYLPASCLGSRRPDFFRV